MARAGGKGMGLGLGFLPHLPVTGLWLGVTDAEAEEVWPLSTPTQLSPTHAQTR